MAEETTKLLQIEDTAPPQPRTDSGAEAKRRDFLKKFGSGVFASLLLPTIFDKKISALAGSAEPAIESVQMPTLPPQMPDEDPIIRMVRDLKRTGQTARRAQVVDGDRPAQMCRLSRLHGRRRSREQAASGRGLPPGDGRGNRHLPARDAPIYPAAVHAVRRAAVRTGLPRGSHVDAERRHREIDYDQCIGCRYCITACPYSARTFDTGRYYTEHTPQVAAAYVGGEQARVYEDAPNFDYGKARPREEGQSPIGNARKCHFCLHRLEKGMLPECVTTCIGRATFFGDANDPKSLLSELISKPNVLHLKEEMGTKPKVHYLL